ncbi:2'-5' RNA ligase family protein [Streptomyces sp. SID13666]|nr:2'-5' RNA ligase family protein [Streptomyces sp. SID13666]NEA73539.1 2'-5' RNA ligase family protein [Streptomyces sp. SID13588]
MSSAHPILLRACRTPLRSPVNPVHHSARSAAFPVDPPASLSDPQTITDHEWRAFSALSEMNDHWDRPGWSASTRRYYWFLTTEHSPEIAQLAVQCQQPLPRHTFDRVPSDGLHVTIARIGDARQVDKQTLQDLADAARLRCHDVPSFTLQAIPIAGSRGAVRMSLAPWEPLLALHEAVDTACTDIGVHEGRSPQDFRPHLGVAYCNRTMDAERVRERIQPLRALPPQVLDVREVHLVELRRENRAYRWDVAHTIPLRP